MTAQRTSRAEPLPSPLIVQERDSRIVYYVGTSVVADTRDLTVLFFAGNKNTANKRLRKLFNGGFLRAHALLGPNAANIYTLGKPGLDWLVKARGVDPALLSSPKTLDIATLDHQLATTTVRTRAVLAARESAGFAVQRFITGAPLQRELKGLGLRAIPDAVLTLRFDRSQVVLVIEVDLGTEPHAVWAGKLAAYGEAIQRSFVFHDNSDWWVVVMVRGEKRLESLRQFLHRHEHGARFHCIELDRLTADAFTRFNPASAPFQPEASPSTPKAPGSPYGIAP